MAQFYLGQIIQGGWNFAPLGTALCNGQLVSIQQATALFSLLGTTFGGNGVQTFGLPNLQGRVPIHWGQGPGLSPYVIGQQAGAENETLLATNLPAHTHPASLSASGGTKATLQIPVAGSTLGHSDDRAGTGSLPAIYCPANTATNTALGGLTVGPAGGSQPFSILQPYLAITFAIVLEGIYPSRS
jgi:microcystin-dependent protein